MGALHGSVNTAEMPDVMCSLETFVTVIGAVAKVSFSSLHRRFQRRQ